MNTYYFNTKDIVKNIDKLSCGDRVYLSGEIYTARDAAHKRFFELLEDNRPLPFQIKNSVIYYAGPTPTPKNLPIGSCGPTTSSRMDPYTPRLYDLGLKCTIGKGNRADYVIDSIKKNKGVYLCAIGGAGALIAQSVTQCEVIAFEDLGCESVKKLVVNNFPLIVGIDSFGNSLFAK